MFYAAQDQRKVAPKKLSILVPLWPPSFCHEDPKAQSLIKKKSIAPYHKLLPLIHFTIEDESQLRFLFSLDVLTFYYGSEVP